MSAPAPGAAATPEQARGRAALLDTVALLAAANHRLTTSQVLAGLDRQGTPHGESTVKRALSQAVRDGVLTTSDQARPPGYGLPHWTDEAKGRES